ncbi:MAG: DUF222 domain-containing protein [Ornithinibacter sp.]
MSMTDWVEVIAQSQAMINQLTAVQAVAVARVAATESVEAEDGTVDERSCLLGHVRLDAAALVAEPLGVTESAAQRRVSLAVREVTVLRSVHESMAAGTIDGWRAALVGEELLDAPDDVARATASRVVDGLARRSGAEVRRRVRRALAAIDEEWLRQRTERARRDRSVRRWAQEPGVDAWFGTFPAEQSAVAWAAVDDLAQRYRRDGSCESIEQARADAMLDLVLGRATTRVTVQLTVPAEPGSAPGPTGDDQRNAAAGPPTGRAVPGAACPFFATAGAGALGGDAVGAQVGCGGAERGGAERGGAERGGSVGGEPAAVSAPGGATATAVESGRAVADDDSAATRALVGHVLQSLPPAGAFVEVRGLDGSGSSEVPAAWVAAHLEQAAAAHSPVGREAVEVFACHPSTGALIDATAALTSEGYRPGAALVRLVRARDGHCRFPGCSTAARFCDLDHVRPWPTGATCADNLVLLCRRHHRVKQSPGWWARLHADGTMAWSTPDGRTLNSEPLDHRRHVGSSRASALAGTHEPGPAGAEPRHPTVTAPGHMTMVQAPVRPLSAPLATPQELITASWAPLTTPLPTGESRAGTVLGDAQASGSQPSRPRSLDPGPFSRLEHAQEHSLAFSTGSRPLQKGWADGPVAPHLSRCTGAIISPDWSRWCRARPRRPGPLDERSDPPPF